MASSSHRVLLRTTHLYHGQAQSVQEVSACKRLRRCPTGCKQMRTNAQMMYKCGVPARPIQCKNMNAQRTYTTGWAPGRYDKLEQSPKSHTSLYRRGQPMCQAQTSGESAQPETDVSLSFDDTQYTELAPEAIPALRKSHMRFVEFFRRASPYVETHRGTCFVLVIPGRVMGNEKRLQSIVKDVALIHQLGVSLVIVIGSIKQIDEKMEKKGEKPNFSGEYRVTTENAMAAALEAAGANTVKMTAMLSKSPAVMQLRRQGMRKQQNSFGVHVASGNYVAAKRRGVVKGVDYGETGEVRFVDVDSISHQLQLNNVVVLSNLGYSAAGEVLNCHTYEVATVAAIQLQADKVVCMLDDVAMECVDEVCMGMRALPLIAAEKLINQFAQQHEMKMHNLREKKLQAESVDASTNGGGEHNPILKHESFQQDAVQATGGAEWYRDGCPVEMCTATAMCRRGVQRVHLVSALTDGGLLLELYTRDGIGIMVFSDDYEVTRSATLADGIAVQNLLAPLVDDGTCHRRSLDELLSVIKNFMVIERNGTIIGCGLLTAFEEDLTAEVGAFAIASAFRGGGRGDRLLESLEQAARDRIPGIRTIFLLTTRTMDWFTERGYNAVGIAHTSGRLPVDRKIDPSRNSKMYIKELEDVKPLSTDLSIFGSVSS